MNRQKLALLVGGLIAIPLAATVLVLILKRVVSDSVAVNFLGPAFTFVGILLFLRYLGRHS